MGEALNVVQKLLGLHTFVQTIGGRLGPKSRQGRVRSLLLETDNMGRPQERVRGCTEALGLASPRKLKLT